MSLENYLVEQQIEREKRDAEASQTPVTPSAPIHPQAPEPSVRDVANQSKKQKQERGITTAIGEFLQSASPENLANNIAAGVNALVPEGAGVLKDATQDVDDFILSREESLEKEAEFIRRERERGNSIGAEFIAGVTAIPRGLEAAIATPLTVAARIENADSSAWAEPPAELKDSLAGETAFEITRIVAPSLLGLPPNAQLARIATESAIETLPQRSADDLILGREAAIKVGELYEVLGGDGKTLTKDLIEGKKPSAQAMTAVAGYLQNFGINLAAETLFGKVAKLLGNSKVRETAEAVAEATGKSVDDVSKSLDDVNLPKADKDLDINEATSIDTGAAKPSAGNSVINEDALVARAIQGSDNPSTTPYFTNLARFTDNASYRQALEEGVRNLERLVEAPVEREKVLMNARLWVEKLLDASRSRIDLDKALDIYPYELNDPIKPSSEFFERVAEFGLDEKQFLKEEAINTYEGAVVSTIIGQELGERLHLTANEVMNLENQVIGWEAAVERYLQLQEKAELFMVPLRRFQRRFHIGGEVLQVDNYSRAKSSVPIKDAQRTSIPLDSDAPSREFGLIRNTPDEEGKTLREWFDLYKQGDKDAGNTIKTYFSILSHSPPQTTIQTMDNLKDVLIRQLRNGNKDATKKLLYAGFLTRLSPQTASLASNILNLIKEPAGLFMSGEGAYASGQVMGAMSVMSDALQAGKRAFQNGYSVNQGTKLDAVIKDSRQLNAELDSLWEGVQKELNQRDAPKGERVLAWWDYTRQRIANNPLNSVAGRMFLAGDEWSKVVYGGMTATGRAVREATESGVKRGSDEFKEILQKHFQEIFVDGVEKGELNAATGVLRAANEITFSNPIPRGGNFVDKAFRFLQDGSKESQFWNFVSPFTRVSYWTMEKGGIVMASSLPLPLKAKQHLLGAVIPRYKDTLDGKFGELAQLQLKSNIAFAHNTSFVLGGMSAMGFVTGNNPDEGLPKNSFIIPSNNDKGYVAVPYGRLEPFASYIAVIADTTKAFRDNVIREQDYSQIIIDVATATGLATFDKSFMKGMGNIADLLDVRNFSPSGLVSGASTLSAVGTSYVAPIGAGAALTRMVTDWVNPYETLSKDDPARNLFGSLMSAISQRNFGGLTNPVKFNPLTGEPVVKVGSLQGGERWKGILRGFANEALIPGRVKTGENQDIYRNLELVGFDSNRFYQGVRSANGVPLSLGQQSTLLEDLHSKGGLATRLRTYFNSSGYKALRKQLINARKDDSQEGMLRTERLEQDILQDINSAYAAAKQRAVSVGRLSKDPDYIQAQRDKARAQRPDFTPRSNLPSPIQGIFDKLQGNY